MRTLHWASEIYSRSKTGFDKRICRYVRIDAESSILGKSRLKLSSVWEDSLPEIFWLAQHICQKEKKWKKKITRQTRIGVFLILKRKAHIVAAYNLSICTSQVIKGSFSGVWANCVIDQVIFCQKQRWRDRDQGPLRFFKRGKKACRYPFLGMKPFFLGAPGLFIIGSRTFYKSVVKR